MSRCPRPPRLTHADELLDAPAHDPAELEASLDDVAAVNRWLGGRRALLHHLAALLPPGRPATLLDAGTGSGDLPRAIVAWARRRHTPVRIVATDLHPQILAIARRRTADFPEIVLGQADVRALPFPDRAFDLALLSLTLHHLDDDDAVRALRELGRVARRAVLVGELERSWPAYLGAKALAATLWRRNRLTRHDGPVSVLRAFTPAELLDLARRAGLANPDVARHPLFRLVLTARPRRRPDA
jgi:2-polyprenyl-3-methyl-5-hydroxy-6-metoxy-1,4-benzoquinol methylase